MEEKLNAMFSSDVATGKRARSPHTRNQTGEYVDERILSGGKNDEVEISDNVSHTDAGGSSHATKRRKKRKKEAAHSLLEDLAESLKSIARSLKEPLRSSCPFTIYQTIQELEKYEEIRDDFELYDYATILLQDDIQRETFMCLPDDFKVKWLRTHYNRRIK